MHRFAFASISISLVTLVAGCTPSPQKLCDKMFELKKKENLDAADDSAKSEEKKLARCVREAEETKAKEPDRYKCLAKCIMGTSSKKDANECKDSCPSSGT